MKYKIKNYVIDAESPEKAVELVKRVEETNSIDFDYLLGEERKAVKDYQNAIEATDDKDKLYVLSHILTEETHHIELLENLRQGKVEFADSVKDSSMTATQEDILMQYAVKYHGYTYEEVNTKTTHELEAEIPPIDYEERIKMSEIEKW